MYEDIRYVLTELRDYLSWAPDWFVGALMLASGYWIRKRIAAAGLPARVFAFSRCMKSDVDLALEAGVLQEEDVYGELGDIVVGRLPGRERDELIVCDLTGIGAQDAALAEIGP